MSTVVSIVMLVFPYFILFFLNKNRVKRFAPVGIFSALVLTIVFQLAERLNWWEVQYSIFPFTNMTSFVYGAFLVGTTVIFYFTYGRFLLYLLMNLITDFVLAFPLSSFYESIGIYKLQEISHLGVWLLTLVIAVLLYGYQIWQDTIYQVQETSKYS